jgi:large subunit ribosomal protein L19
MPIVKHLKEEQLKSMPEFKAGYTVRVHNKIKEGSKERVQIFEGLVIAKKGGKGVNATFTVRKIASGVGVERIFPMHSPNIVKLEVVKSPTVSHAKIYYVRERQHNDARVRMNKPAKSAKSEK